MEKRTSQNWERRVPKEVGLTIRDHDGWDRTDFQHSFNQEMITKDEFIERVEKSTIEVGNQAAWGKWKSNKFEF